MKIKKYLPRNKKQHNKSTQETEKPWTACINCSQKKI